MTGTAPTATEQPQPPRRKREILGPAGLVVMVVAILLFTAGAIIYEVATNSGKSYRATVDVLGPAADAPGSRNEYQVVFHVTNRGSKAGRPDKCEAVLYDMEGHRVGTATVSLREPIPPGDTHDELAVGTAAGVPVNGAARCRALEPQ